VTGFDFWGDLSTIVEKYYVRTADPADSYNMFGRDHRAHVVGHDIDGRPLPVLDFDQQSQTFSVPPDVRRTIHRYLRDQNFSGLTEKAAETADNLGQLTEGAAPGEHRRFSRGCPVAGTPSIQKAVEFSGQVFGIYVDYYDHFDRTLQ
jgi:hypothetical protein